MVSYRPVSAGRNPIGGKTAPSHTGGITTGMPGGGYAPPSSRAVGPASRSTMGNQSRDVGLSLSASSGPSPSAPGATPYGAAGQSADTLSGFGTGLLDPESDESKRWMEELRENIGRSTEAGQRAAGYQAAQQGFGAGASPEMLEMQQMLGVAGQEAEGGAASDFMLQAPGMGVDALSRAMGAQVGMRGQDLQGRMAEMSDYASREQANAGMEMQQRNLDLERDRMEQDRYLRELMMEYGGY